MRKELFGCFVSSSVIIILAIIVLNICGYLPLFEPCIPVDYSSRPSSSIEESKQKNVFMWEYGSDVFQYKDAIIKIDSAFLEQKYRRDKDDIAIQNGFCLQVFFDDNKSWYYMGYNETWLINEYCFVGQDGHIIEFFDDLKDSFDTLFFYIREKHTSFDSIDGGVLAEPVVTWDTVQCFNLIRKINE